MCATDVCEDVGVAWCNAVWYVTFPVSGCLCCGDRFGRGCVGAGFGGARQSGTGGVLCVRVACRRGDVFVDQNLARALSIRCFRGRASYMNSLFQASPISASSGVVKTVCFTHRL